MNEPQRTGRNSFVLTMTTGLALTIAYGLIVIAPQALRQRFKEEEARRVRNTYEQSERRLLRIARSPDDAAIRDAVLHPRRLGPTRRRSTDAAPSPK